MQGNPDNLQLIAPSLYQYIEGLEMTIGDKMDLFRASIAKVQPAYDKLNFYMGGRILEGVLIFKACRLFNYRFIGSCPHEAVLEDLEILRIIPNFEEGGVFEGLRGVFMAY